jgi:hypothetical protein
VRGRAVNSTAMRRESMKNVHPRDDVRAELARLAGIVDSEDRPWLYLHLACDVQHLLFACTCAISPPVVSSLGATYEIVTLERRLMAFRGKRGFSPCYMRCGQCPRCRTIYWQVIKIPFVERRAG